MAEELPGLLAASSENIWALVLISLLCAIILAFASLELFAMAKEHSNIRFHRSWQHRLSLFAQRRNYAKFLWFHREHYFQSCLRTHVYGILPTTTENFGALMSGAGLALAAYVVVPILGGIIGFTCPISPLVSPSLATTIQKSHLVLKKQQLKVISGKIMEKVIEVKNLVKVYGKAARLLLP